MAQVIQPNVVMKPSDMYKEATSQALDAYKTMSSVMDMKKQTELQEKQFEWNKKLQMVDAVYNGFLVPFANRTPGGMQGVFREMGPQLVPLMELMGFSKEAATSFVKSAADLPPGHEEIMEKLAVEWLVSEHQAEEQGMHPIAAQLGATEKMLQGFQGYMPKDVKDGARSEASRAEAASPPQPSSPDPKRTTQGELTSKGAQAGTPVPSFATDPIIGPGEEPDRPAPLPDVLPDPRPPAQARAQDIKLEDTLHSLERVNRIADTPVGQKAGVRMAGDAIKQLKVFTNSVGVTPEMIKSAGAKYTEAEVKDFIEGRPGASRAFEMEAEQRMKELESDQKFRAALFDTEMRLQIFDTYKNLGFTERQVKLMEDQFEWTKPLQMAELDLDERRQVLSEIMAVRSHQIALAQLRLQEAIHKMGSSGDTAAALQAELMKTLGTIFNPVLRSKDAVDKLPEESLKIARAYLDLVEEAAGIEKVDAEWWVRDQFGQKGFPTGEQEGKVYPEEIGKRKGFLNYKELRQVPQHRMAPQSGGTVQSGGTTQQSTADEEELMKKYRLR